MEARERYPVRGGSGSLQSRRPHRHPRVSNKYKVHRIVRAVGNAGPADKVGGENPQHEGFLRTPQLPRSIGAEETWEFWYRCRISWMGTAVHHHRCTSL